MASRLDDPGYPEALAELINAGLSWAEVAAGLNDGTHPDTARKWARDARVQAHLSRLREERVNRITRKVDAEIEKRLASAAALAQMDMKDIVALRRELLGPAAQRVTIHRGADEAQATAELVGILARNPELAAALGAEGVAEGNLLDAGDPVEDDDPE